MVWRFLSLYLVIVNGLWAASNEALIGHLRSRMVKGHQGYLIQSYATHSQSYIYDQALAIIMFSKNKNFAEAQKLLSALNELQQKDGSLYFSYNLDGSSIYPEEGDKRFAGAIAWVAIAASTYQKESGSVEFKNFNYKLLSYLGREFISIKGEKFKAIRFAPKDIASSAWKEDETIALEHNIDAYSAFRNYQAVNQSHEFKKQVQDLDQFVTKMWDKKREHFWSGMNAQTGIVNKDEYYLDNQSWTLLALDEKHSQKFNFKSALKKNCESLLATDGNQSGFLDSKPTRRPASVQFVWSEGTAGQILAMKNQNISCKNYSFDEGLKNLNKMRKEDGGIAYASNNKNPDFSAESSIAGTTWYYFALNKINPFAI